MEKMGVICTPLHLKCHYIILVLLSHLRSELLQRYYHQQQCSSQQEQACVVPPPAAPPPTHTWARPSASYEEETLQQWLFCQSGPSCRDLTAPTLLETRHSRSLGYPEKEKEPEDVCAGGKRALEKPGSRALRMWEPPLFYSPTLPSTLRGTCRHRSEPNRHLGTKPAIADKCLSCRTITSKTVVILSL